MLSKTDYTKERISKALIHLLQKYPIDQITISKLVDEAQVSRGAFYNHYHNLEDVLKNTYQNAHSNTFKDRLQDINYLLSDEYIWDMITFFDQNSELLLALYKWNLFEFIPKHNTEIVIHHTEQFHDSMVKNYAVYFMCYSSIQYFTIGIAWLLNGKKETPKELYQIIRYFKQLEKK